MKINLAVGVISNRDWEPRFGVSMVNLYGHLLTNGIKGHELTGLGFFPFLNCSNICQARTTVINRAKASQDGANNLLAFFDDDMVFPPNVLDLLARNIDDDQVDLIGANYKNKTQPRPTAVGMDWKHIPSKGKTGIEEVLSVGFGCTLMKLSIVDKSDYLCREALPMPWFAHEYIERLGNQTTDDTFFCLHARAHGRRIWLDHDASQDIKHIGKNEQASL